MNYKDWDEPDRNLNILMPRVMGDNLVTKKSLINNKPTFGNRGLKRWTAKS